MLIWATGNRQVPLVEQLKVSKRGRLARIVTDQFLRPLDLDGKPIMHAYAIGDAADIEGGELPTTAEVACQKGEHVARMLNKGVEEPFTYQQRAMVAYVGQHDGVIAGRKDWTGPSAWLAWRSKNLSWARSWRSRILIAINWTMNSVFGKEMARV